MPILRGNHSVLSAELRRYTRGSLRALLEGAGFRVERMTYTNAVAVPDDAGGPRRAARWWGWRRRRTRSGEITVPAAPVNAALSALLSLEARAVRAVPMPFGSSLLCLARKPA